MAGLKITMIHDVVISIGGTVVPSSGLVLDLRGSSGLFAVPPPATFRTVLLRPNISVRLARDIPFAHRDARSAPGAAGP